MIINRNPPSVNTILKSGYSLASLIFLTIFVLASPSMGAPGITNHFRAGIHTTTKQHGPEKSQLDYLIDSLRRETGLIELHFNQEGYLGIHNRDRVSGGSATARGLILAAIDGHLAIELETHNSSPRVVFADVVHKITIRYTENEDWLDVFSLRMDFADFHQLQGDREAKTAFDPGIVFLHELTHLVLNLKDDMTRHGSNGECITYINRIRRELGQPERVQYSYDIVTNEYVGRKTIVWGRLKFAQQMDGRKNRDYQLFWLADMVGNIRTR